MMQSTNTTIAINSGGIVATQPPAPSPLTSQTKYKRQSHNISLPIDAELGELMLASALDTTSSSAAGWASTSRSTSPNGGHTSSAESAGSSASEATSPNGKINLVISNNTLEYNYNYLLKQMNKRKLHLPCPLCNSLVVNMSDHLAKTHLILDIKERKLLLNTVRNNYILNPSGFKQVLESNRYLLAKIRCKGPALLLPNHADDGRREENPTKKPEPLAATSSAQLLLQEIKKEASSISGQKEDLLKTSLSVPQASGFSATPTMSNEIASNPLSVDSESELGQQNKNQPRQEDIQAANQLKMMMRNTAKKQRSMPYPSVSNQENCRPLKVNEPQSHAPARQSATTQLNTGSNMNNKYLTNNSAIVNRGSSSSTLNNTTSGLLPAVSSSSMTKTAPTSTNNNGRQTTLANRLLETERRLDTTIKSFNIFTNELFKQVSQFRSELNKAADEIKLIKSAISEETANK
jgi:hypothetical protein